MSKSIASQVRSMAKQMVDVQIYKCADQILVEMCNVFRDYMLNNNFPTIYNAEVLLILDRNWHNYTFTEIELACRSLGLHHETGANKCHRIKMLPFVKGGKMNKAQEFYKVLRPSVIEETKWTKAIMSNKCKNLDVTQRARIKAKAYLAQILNQLKLGNFSAEQISPDKYQIKVPVYFPGKLIPYSMVQVEEISKAFKKHHFYLRDFCNSQCIFTISTH